MALFRGKWTAVWKCLLNPSRACKWQASTTKSNLGLWGHCRDSNSGFFAFLKVAFATRLPRPCCDQIDVRRLSLSLSLTLSLTHCILTLFLILAHLVVALKAGEVTPHPTKRIWTQKKTSMQKMSSAVGKSENAVSLQFLKSKAAKLRFLRAGARSIDFTIPYWIVNRADILINFCQMDSL